MITKTEIVVQMRADLDRARGLLQLADQPGFDVDRVRAAVRPSLELFDRAEAERLEMAIGWYRQHCPEGRHDDRTSAAFITYLRDLGFTVDRPRGGMAPDRG